MTAWVGIGVALMFLGVYTSVWVTFLGACVIGSTPVFFTLRAALSPRRSPPRAESHRETPIHASASRPAPRRHAPARRRDHG